MAEPSFKLQILLDWKAGLAWAVYHAEGRWRPLHSTGLWREPGEPGTFIIGEEGDRIASHFNIVGMVAQYAKYLVREFELHPLEECSSGTEAPSAGRWKLEVKGIPSDEEIAMHVEEYLREEIEGHPDVEVVIDHELLEDD